MSGQDVNAIAMIRDDLSLAVGDRAPNFVLPDESDRFVMFYERTQGRPVVLLLVPAAATPTSAAVLAAFRSAAADFAAAGLDVFCVCSALPDRAVGTGAGGAKEQTSAGPLIWWDKSGKILAAYLAALGGGAEDQVCALLLDANQRILGQLQGNDAQLPEQVQAFYRHLPAPRQPVTRRTAAPVLLVPRLLPEAWCARLRALHDGRGSGPSGGSAAQPGATLPVASAMAPESLQNLKKILGRRLAPELHKAFNVESFKLEDLALTSGKAAGPKGGGFVLIVNLSADVEDEGRDEDNRMGLIFPEYGAATYRPPAGGGLIHSADLAVVQTLPLLPGGHFLRCRLQG